jgi:hypothetical protein
LAIVFAFAPNLPHSVLDQIPLRGQIIRYGYH